jgi:N6-adenosine-specific RNA methylase IME4
MADAKTALEFHPLANVFPLIDSAAFDVLVADVAANGVREPIWLNDGLILDGRNRYRASVAAGIECPMRIYDGDDPIGFVVSENFVRRHLNESQRAMIAEELANMRQGERTDLPQRCGKSISQKRAADMLNVGERNVQHARKVRNTDSAVAALVVAGTINLHEGKKLIALPVVVRRSAVEAVASGTDVRTAVREANKESYNARIEAAKPKPLEGTYRILLADPPWKYHGLNQADEYGHAERHYDCLDDDQLCAYRPGDGDRTVKDLADKDAVLFLWVTAPMLERAFPIIKAWGLKYKTNLVWDKIDHVMGFYTSVRQEQLLIATRGAYTPDTGRLIDSVQTIKRSDRHSEKPPKFYEIIEAMFDHGRKLELFAPVGVKVGTRRATRSP